MNRSIFFLTKIQNQVRFLVGNRFFSTKLIFQKNHFILSNKINLNCIRRLNETKTQNENFNTIKKDIKSIQKNLGKRIKKQSKNKLSNQHQNALNIVALSTAESYDLIHLKKTITNEGIYEILEIDDSDSDRECLCLKAKYKGTLTSNEDETRIIFVFNDGTCVFWNFEDQLEQNSLLRSIQQCSLTLYDVELVKNETEMLTYSIEEAMNQTRLNKNHINIAANSENIILEKYAFSDAISTSIKLGILENKLEIFIEKIEHISEDLKNGSKLKITSQEVLQNTGELLAMRHLINLRFDLLKTPDFYWDREKLESLYLSTNRFLDISKRTRVFNDKLNYCIDLMRILESNLNEKKHTKLEWLIIILIAIEGFIGILSLFIK